ncbi:DegT/DnrJ/EryC1/StrS family aminotransferase [bacterium]|nr:DegT/DnrJ/EryC1/StrS family aminotransferase [bacterium]MBU4133960.1 DegT/DnrJ/EryC1/StrS family aminotransferase [bacterium]
MIPITDLGQQYNEIKNEISRAVEKVLAEGKYILGPEVTELEERIAAYCGVRYGVGVASGTDALVLSVIAAGIGEGDEVITTPFTFIATIEAVIRAGAKPVFADIDAKTYNINPAEIESKITSKTKAIIPVHLYGLSCDMAAITKIAKKHNLTVIEDCAQSFGAAIGGKITGSFGDFGCFSFFPAKNLGCYGDGGMVVTDNKEYADKIKLLRMHGFSADYDYRLHGFNSRLDTLQAAIVNVKMNHIDGWIEKRVENAAKYAEGLKNVKDAEAPFMPPGYKHAMNYYALRISGGRQKRDGLKKYLTEKGIGNNIYYPLSLHLQEICADMGYKKGDYPVSEKTQDEIISLPMYPELGAEKIEFICGEIKKYFRV